MKKCPIDGIVEVDERCIGCIHDKNNNCNFIYSELINPINLRKKFLKDLKLYLKPVNYNLSCKGYQSELVERLVKIIYQHFKKK